MKLLSSPASPFARKVLVVAHELGIAQQLEVVQAKVSPVESSEAVEALNPLGKIPTLVLDNGNALYDSMVIAEFLDTRAGQKLFPAPGPSRWRALRRAAAADGMADALVLVRYERTIRPAKKQSGEWIDGQMGKVRRTLDALEAEGGSISQVGIGGIAIACALGYLDFRFADFEWRTGHPTLTEFYTKFAERESMRATQPT